MIWSKPTRRTDWAHWLARVLIILGVLLILFFGLRTARSYLHLQRTTGQVQVDDVAQIRGWMTVQYLATAFAVPEAVLFDSLAVPEAGNRTRSLRALNRAYALGERRAMVARARQAITRYRAVPSVTDETPR